MQPFHANVWYVLGGLLVALCLGTLVRIAQWLRSREAARWHSVGSMLVWWSLSLAVTAALLLGRLGVVVLFAATSCFALREFLSLTSARRNHTRGEWVAYVAVPVQYACIYFGALQAAWLAVPAGALILLAARSALGGKTTGYLATVAGVYWGVMLTVVCLSHPAMLLALDEDSNPVAGAAGWFLFLVLLVQASDISQALWGRALGRRKIAPVVSPHKTWEGFLLGMATTVALAVLLGWLLTPLTAPYPVEIAGRKLSLPYLLAVGAGLVIFLAGFAGDINMSAVKRDIGVKDSGNWLPTQGGILDRLDSLTFAAPVFFFYVYLIYG